MRKVYAGLFSSIDCVVDSGTPSRGYFMIGVGFPHILRISDADHGQGIPVTERL